MASLEIHVITFIFVKNLSYMVNKLKLKLKVKNSHYNINNDRFFSNCGSAALCQSADLRRTIQKE